MRKRVRSIVALAVVFCAITVAGCRSLSYVHGSPENANQLWYAVLKPFDRDVYYVGSDGEYSYFRQGYVFYSRYKAQTSKLKLPRTFPFGKGQPYIVTIDMVPENY
jgi:hypothetical protein